MGWLGKLFGKQDTPDDDTPPAATMPFAGYGRLDEAGKREQLQAFFTQLAPSFDAGHVVVRANDRAVDLCGQRAGFAIRIKGGSSGFEPELKLEAAHATMTLMFDPNLDRAKETPADATWSSDELRIFVDKSIFFAGPAQGHMMGSTKTAAEFLRDQARAFMALPPELQARIRTAMIGERINTLSVRKSTIEIHLRDRGPDEQIDPSRRLVAVVQLMSEVAAAVTQVAPATADGTVGELVRCSYCTCEFFLDAHAACTHCGAPFKR